MRRMLLAGGIALSFVAAGCGGSSGSGTKSTASQPPAGGPSTGAALGVSEVGNLGKILTGPNGRTLYLFKKDHPTGSSCTGICANAWLPLTTQSTPQAGQGLQPSLLGTVKRPDGTMQVTYGGHPLYYFTQDTRTGTAIGQSITAYGGGWYAVSPDGKQIGR